MTVYNASKMLTGVQPRVLPSASGVKVFSSIALVAALAINDTINMAALEADPSDPNGLGPTVLGMLIDSDALDTGNTMTLDLGDVNSAQRFIAATTIAQAGGIARPTIAGTTGYQPFSGSFANYTTVSLQTYVFVVKVHANPGVWQNGTLRFLVDYTYDP